MLYQFGGKLEKRYEKGWIGYSRVHFFSLSLYDNLMKVVLHALHNRVLSKSLPWTTAFTRSKGTTLVKEDNKPLFEPFEGQSSSLIAVSSPLHETILHVANINPCIQWIMTVVIN